MSSPSESNERHDTVVMQHEQIRKIIKENLAEVKRLMLTERLIEIIDFCDREATSEQVAAVFCLSIQNASSTLKKLFDKGYLNRIERVHESGGVEYYYYAA